MSLQYSTLDRSSVTKSDQNIFLKNKNVNILYIELYTPVQTQLYIKKRPYCSLRSRILEICTKVLNKYQSTTVCITCQSKGIDSLVYQISEDR